MSEKSPEYNAIPGSCVPETALSGLPEPWGGKRMQKGMPAEAIGVHLAGCREAKWKFRLTVFSFEQIAQT